MYTPKPLVHMYIHACTVATYLQFNSFICCYILLCSCCSEVGRSGGKQYVSLARGCFSFRTIAHEIGHAIGFWHEQSRPDRDEHVKVYFGRIKQTSVYNFNKHLGNVVTSFRTPYDAISVMQYSSYSFSTNGMKTIESKYGLPLGGAELSPVDILQTRRMYRCSSGMTAYGACRMFVRVCLPLQTQRMTHPRWSPHHLHLSCQLRLRVVEEY